MILYTMRGWYDESTMTLNWMKWLDDFHEHKISNTGWVWNGDERERSGTEQNRRECSTFLNLHFLDQKWSEDLELALANWEDSANPGKCTIYTVVSTDFTFQYAHKTRQENQCNEASHPRKGSTLSQHKIWRSLLAIWICYIAAKKPQPLYEMRWKGKQGKCSQTDST